MISSINSGPPQPSESGALMSHTSKRLSKASTGTVRSSQSRAKLEQPSSSGSHLQWSFRSTNAWIPYADSLCCGQAPCSAATCWNGMHEVQKGDATYLRAVSAHDQDPGQSSLMALTSMSLPLPAARAQSRRGPAALQAGSWHRPCPCSCPPKALALDACQGSTLLLVGGTPPHLPPALCSKQALS